MTFRSILHRLEESILAALLCAMTVLTFVQVVLRYGFNSGWLWALEVNFYLFGWLVLLGISYGVRVKAHIGVDALVRLFPAPTQRAIGILVVGLALLYTGLMLYGSYEYIDRLHIMAVEAEDIPVERWILSLCLPIGFALLFYRLLEMTWRIVTGQSPGYELADEARDAIRDVGGDENPDATVVSR
ncbi:C4-dicarboxylate ABC transporter permease [Afipia sp. Root123D2]|uniref:TRAP transporter small permease n=1 Tax=Afipia sp. Root123D2 TaxID=1736436 RepID=UPI0006FDA348|nr:TRAP transporter small permease [Afipia sp. Root123D2]KQW22109.1 C4-dicarboxylate ABC transporter permease [Afipia sp. Root123D2]